MLVSFIKYSFIYFFCIFICTKSLPIFKYSFRITIFLSCIFAISASFFNLYTPSLRYIFPIIAFWIITSLQNLNPKASFTAITISFTLSFYINALSNVILITIFLPFFRESTNYILLALLTGILQSIIILKLFSLKRFRKGIPFLSSTTHSNVAMFLCLIIIGFSVYMTTEHTTFQQRLLFSFTVIIFLFVLAFLIYWWQAQITKAYRRNLELRELESIRMQLAEVLKENERLALIAHRDNTLISALKKATVTSLSIDYSDPDEAYRIRQELIANIEALSAGRNDDVDETHEKNARIFDTGKSLLDRLLHEMDEKAIEKNITFSVHMGISLDDFIPHGVSENDLVHTVDDLLKNAFKSTLTCEKRVVQLQFYKLGKHLVVEVSDNGIPFEAKSLVNMGLERLTTYEDGTGYGLVDIWRTKDHYGATYHLDEYETAAPFSKKISLTFDKKNRYSIRTWRKPEILQMSRRADLQVYDHNEQ